jgi:hypothetical protein
LRSRLDALLTTLRKAEINIDTYFIYLMQSKMEKSQKKKKEREGRD